LRQIPEVCRSHLIHLLYDYEVQSLQHASRNTQRKVMAVFLGALKERSNKFHCVFPLQTHFRSGGPNDFLRDPLHLPYIDIRFCRSTAMLREICRTILVIVKLNS